VEAHWDRVPEAVQGLNWNGQVVIDATNDWGADDLQGRTSSEVVADLVAGARLVKAANTLGADVLGSDPHEAGGERVIFISGDDADANRMSSRCSKTRASLRSTSATWQQAARCSRSTTRCPASTSSVSEEQVRDPFGGFGYGFKPAPARSGPEPDTPRSVRPGRRPD
jgi:hypothetical protein